MPIVMAQHNGGRGWDTDRPKTLGRVPPGAVHWRRPPALEREDRIDDAREAHIDADRDGATHDGRGSADGWIGTGPQR